MAFSGAGDRRGAVHVDLPEAPHPHAHPVRPAHLPRGGDRGRGAALAFVFYYYKPKSGTFQNLGFICFSIAAVVR